MQNTNRIRVLLVVLGLGLGAGQVPASGAGIVNGSFETGPNPGLSTELPTGSTAITGWTVINNPIDYTGTFWVASDGTRSLDLNGTSSPVPGGISQAFSTTPGTSYDLLFDMAGNPAGGPTIKTLEVSAAGQSANFSFDITGKSVSNMGWITESWTFTATSTTTTLEFISTTPNSFFGPALDNVRVSAAVPEPATLSLLGIGMLGTSLMVRAGRRRRKAGETPVS